MTLKPNRLRAFLKTFLWVFALIMVFFGLAPQFQGKSIILQQTLVMAVIGSCFMGISVAVMFTPREITWDDEIFTIKALFPGSGRFTWKQLEAYSSFGKGMATFLIKFEGHQAFQIVPAGFRSDEWKAFQSVLRLRFPERMTWFWFGPMPIRFGKK